MQRLLLFFAFGLFLHADLSTVAAADSAVEFNRDIRPILSQNCFYCHGFDEANREAGLRLDTLAGATADLGGYQAIVPGDPDASEIVLRIRSEDPDQIMPPPHTEQTLSEQERELIERWIEAGAEYEEHWAWRPLVRPQVPGEQTDNQTDNQTVNQTGAAAIDAFLRAGWEDHQAQPVAPATPRTLLRRLSLDLRGFPPTIDEVRAFEADPSDDHFERFRDRWMNELAYAEHQAVRWLDLVRWADTSGFVSDEPIASGAYRAWVIRAIAENMPFDQFSIAQLAGDLLPNPSDDDLIASGYNRIVNTNCEAGAIELEQLYKLKGEHVRALGTVWLGMTTGCAECHDHKFDPLSAKDYYSLAAFFDDLVEAGVYTPGDRREPLHYVHDEADARERDAQLSAKIRRLKKEIAAAPRDGMEAWREQLTQSLKDTGSRRDFVWAPAQLPAPRIVEGQFETTTINDRLARRTEAEQDQFKRHHAAEFMTGYVNEGSQKTDDENDAWFVNVWIDPEDRPQMLGLQISHGDYGRLGWRPANYETYYWGKDTSQTLEQSHPWSDPKRVVRVGDLPDESGWVRLQVPLKQRIKPVPGQSFEAVGMAWLQTGGSVAWGDSGLNLRNDKVTTLELGETAIRLWWETPVNRQTYQSRMALVPKAVRKAPRDRDATEKQLAELAYLEQSQRERMERLRQLESELFVMRSQALPVLVSRQTDDPKTTRLLSRGDYSDKSGPILDPALPGFLTDDERSESDLNRLDLANWLFSADNPITARVFVNRLWHQFYGRGISETLEDAGTQGDWPSHIDLLDWLACEFRDSGWDRNHMVRLLTSTQAYRLSSKPTADLAERDPGNRWHARQSRYRMNAEAIRDSALRAAGLLKTTNQIPIHSFFPYQPDPYWTRSDKVMFGSRHMEWETSPNRKQYHRSVYTFWKRQNIHPTMLAFDAPTRQECTAKRNITNTPGQALALLNDPMFVEAARAFAMRICDQDESSNQAESGTTENSDDERRIDRVFQIALQRSPTASEREVLLKLLQSQREHYQKHPADAKQLLQIGQLQSPSERSAIEIAAWTAVTRAILNTHEFLNRS
jgi:mono/diheme cytochrome c family protein